MTWILGLNAHHADSAACLLRDGEVVAAAEEERFRRVKHWAGFPSRAVSWCLRSAGTTLDQIDHAAVNLDPRSRWAARLAFALRHRPPLRTLLERLLIRRRQANLLAELRAGGFQGRFHRVEHHLAHLASAGLASPFARCLAVSVDQFGDFASTAWGPVDGGRVRVEGRIDFPDSLGTFYSAMTQFLGFPHYGDEYKVMGLAPYGEPRYLEVMRRVVRTRGDGRFSLDLRYFRHHRERVYSLGETGAPVVQDLFRPELEALLGPRRWTADPLEQRHRDLARSTQARYEEVFFELLNHLHAAYGLDDLALAGGCAMNSVANGKVHECTPFKRLFVQAAAGDSGGAMGAALAVHCLTGGGSREWVMRHAYLGPSYEEGELDALLASCAAEIERAGCQVQRPHDENTLCRETARAIAEGQVVGWFQGRMEWGPRALGNRSILGDPRRADMKDLLNRKIKRRESFRPFAPSILRESVHEWFEHDADVPFMTQVYRIRPERRSAIPAVTHVDGTGRLQTVRREDNPRFYRLIEAFQETCGVPLVLNTSFNENEPVVCTPSEALDCFLRTRMDRLVLGDSIIQRVSRE